MANAKKKTAAKKPAAKKPAAKKPAAKKPATKKPAPRMVEDGPYRGTSRRPSMQNVPKERPTTQIDPNLVTQAINVSLPHVHGRQVMIVHTGVALKLGKLAVHADEFLGSGSDPLDVGEIRTLLCDEDVRDWVRAMGALLPLKRTPGLLEGVDASPPPKPDLDPKDVSEAAGLTHD